MTITNAQRKSLIGLIRNMDSDIDLQVNPYAVLVVKTPTGEWYIAPQGTTIKVHPDPATHYETAPDDI